MDKRKTKRLLVDRTSVLVARLATGKNKRRSIGDLAFPAKCCLFERQMAQLCSEGIGATFDIKKGNTCLMVLNLNILQSTSLLYHIIA